MMNIDRESIKKAFQLFETGKIDAFEVGTTKGLVQVHEYIFRDLYDFAGIIREKNISKGGFQFAVSHFLGNTLKQIDAMPETTFHEIVN